MPLDSPITTIALADTRWVGHHPTFFREISAACQRLGLFVIALCPEPGELEATDRMFAAPLRPSNAGLLRGLEHDPVSTVARWWAVRRALDRAERECGRRAGAVFFPYADGLLRGLPGAVIPDVVLGRPWSGLYFRPQHLLSSERPPVSRLRGWAKGDHGWRSRSTLPCLAVLDERCVHAVAAISGREVVAFPDITDESPAAQHSPLAQTLQARAQGRPIIGLAGSLEKRKGLITLLRTAEASAGAGDPWFFAAVGTFADETFEPHELTWIDATCRRLADVVFLDRSRQRIPDGPEYNAVFSSFAVAWAAYEGFQGSSNSLTKAAMLHIPVIATTGECIGHRVHEYALGATIAEGDHRAARDAIARILAEDHAGSINRRFAAYHRMHDRPRLEATLRRLLTLPPTPPPARSPA